MLAGMALAFFIPSVKPAQCPSGTVAISVTSIPDVQILSDALNCTGPGVFDVTWKGDLQLDRRIDASDMKIVTVTGSGFPTHSGALDRDNDSGAIGDARPGAGIFLVSDGSALHLNNVALYGGNAERGGAVSVLSSSYLSAFGCTFTNRIAIEGGGEDMLCLSYQTGRAESNHGFLCQLSVPIPGAYLQTPEAESELGRLLAMLSATTFLVSCLPSVPSLWKPEDERFKRCIYYRAPGVSPVLVVPVVSPLGNAMLTHNDQELVGRQCSRFSTGSGERISSFCHIVEPASSAKTLLIL